MKFATVIGAVFLNLASPIVTTQNEAKEVTGRVLDYISRKDGEIGVPGVSVAAFNEDSKELAATLTDGDGRYKLKVLDPAQINVIVHQKVGYRRDPEIWHRYGSTENGVVIVRMIRLNAGPNYYSALAEAILERALGHNAPRYSDPSGKIDGLTRAASAGNHDSRSLLGEWSGLMKYDLPAAQRDLVRDHIKGRVGRSTEMAIITGMEVSHLVPEIATQVGKNEGFLGTIYFELNSSDIPATIKHQLVLSVAFVNGTDFTLLIEGHAGESDTSEDNLALSEKRAHAVKNVFLGFGVAPERLVIVPFGEHHPLCPEKICQVENRRVEFRLLKRNGGQP